MSFAAYNLQARQLLWKELKLAEEWWAGMSAADGDVLVLHTFDDSENPEVKSFFAINNATQEVIWEGSELQVMEVYQGQLYGFVRKNEVTSYKRVSLETNGEKNLSLKELEHSLQDVFGENKYIRQPFHYSEEDAYFSTVSRFVQHYLNRRPVRSCEYLDAEGLIFISYYIEEDRALANYLLVVDTEGELLLHEKLDDQLSHPGLGTFMIIRDQLIFIKQKKELLSYAI